VPATGLPADSALRDAGLGHNLRLAGTEQPGARRVYIVQLREPSAAELHSRSTAVSGKAGGPPLALRMDRNDPGIRDHTLKLAAEQDRVLALAGGGTEKLYSYVYGMNGFAARMTPEAAHKLEALPEVVNVWEDEIRPLATNYSPNFLDLYDGNGGLRGALGLDGENVVIGFIDSGVYPEHPSLGEKQEVNRPRLCRGSWAENSLLGRWLCRRFRRAEDVVMYEPPAAWNGICEAGTQFDATACNNKLIGARWFAEGAQASGPIDDNEIFSPRDVDGHGTHTATTAAGNRVTASLYGASLGTVEGMAPRARVAVYKACWLRPGDQRATCNTSDLASAVDAAVADGVDIINYSVGSSLLRIAAPDDIALFGAAKAGVLAVVAAGNDGPNLGTIGSPAGGPWVLTTGASTRDGETSIEAMQINAPAGLAGRYAVREASFTPPLADVDLIEGALVLADDGEDVLPGGEPGTTSDACEALINGTELNGNIALIQRGGCDFDVKVLNAADAGASAVVVFNDAGPAIVMGGSISGTFVPAVMVGQADGGLFLAEIDAGNVITAVLDKSLFLTQAETGNIMPAFSSRGPGPVEDLLKPDVTAPGSNILAGISPDAVNSPSGQPYGYLSGTSMATPHVSGVAALLLELHPDWSPAALKSALMTSTRQDLTLPDGETPLHAFDFGAGHIVPNAAADPGLVYDLSADDYDAAACGFGYEVVPADRCAELESAGFSLLARDLNLPSIAVARLTGQQTVTRRVKNVDDAAATYTATVEPPAGMQVLVEPPSLALGPGETGEFDVTITYESGPLDLWSFGALTWQSGDHEVRSPIAVKPSTVSAPSELTAEGANGTLAFDVAFGYSGVYEPRVHGLRLPLVIDGFVDNDPSKTFTFRSTDGVTAHLVDVPADQLYLRFSLFDALTDGEDDLDMYVYYCPDGVTCNKIGESGEPTSQERFDYYRPPAGRYAVLIHGFATDQVAGGPGANYSLLGWSLGDVDDRGNMTVTGPSFVAGGTETVSVDWFGLSTGTIYFGAVSHNTPSGLAALTLISILVPN
jgi:subtilisin family serine protease